MAMTRYDGEGEPRGDGAWVWAKEAQKIQQGLEAEILRLSEENKALKAPPAAEDDSPPNYGWEADGTSYLASEQWGLERLENGLAEADDSRARFVASEEILRLAAKNARVTEGGRVMLKALRILAHEMWVCFKEDMEVDPDANREALEAAGLIEMLPDQTWSLTELGGRVCRRES